MVPHVLSERNLLLHIKDCDTLIRRERNNLFLKSIVTGDEKCAVYNNLNRKRSWSKKTEPAQTTSPKKKIKLSVWWDFKWIVYIELLPANTTINSEVYCNQLDKLSDALKETRIGQRC